MAVATVVFSLTAIQTAWPGGGPENVLLVVNEHSDASKEVANHYIALRQIPPENVLYIHWRASRATVGGNTFREHILMRTLNTIESRKLNAQIDYVIYAPDFPFRVDLKSLFPDHKFEAPFNGPASLTGATYLTPMMVNRDPAIVLPVVNWYVPNAMGPNQFQCTSLSNVPTRGFSSQYLWDSNGNRTTDPKKGQRYLLSTMLGVTYGRGNTVEEILAYLRRAASADGKRPRGTIYYMKNDDVRSTQRDKCFTSVAAQINRIGVQAKVLEGTIPMGAKDVMGLSAGVANFNWGSSGSTIQPGAICEHLTSAGAIFDAKHQTPLTEFLRYGAAGASGTVREPQAVQAKFPLPSIHLHYARGCTLAEAFYQSVSGPYQLLVVGDPLCRPWAVIPKVTLSGVQPDQEVKGPLTISPAATASGGHRIGSYHLFVDGRLTARIPAEPAGQSLTLDTTKMADGYHELRLVALNAGSVETQGRTIVPFRVKNHDATLEVTMRTPASIAQSDKIVLAVKQIGAETIEIRQNSRVVGSVKGEAGDVEIAAATVGRGPVLLQAFSTGEVPLISAPIKVEVK